MFGNESTGHFCGRMSEDMMTKVRTCLVQSNLANAVRADDALSREMLNKGLFLSGYYRERLRRLYNQYTFLTSGF